MCDPFRTRTIVGVSRSQSKGRCLPASALKQSAVRHPYELLIYMWVIWPTYIDSDSASPPSEQRRLQQNLTWRHLMHQPQLAPARNALKKRSQHTATLYPGKQYTIIGSKAGFAMY